MMMDTQGQAAILGSRQHLVPLRVALGIFASQTQFRFAPAQVEAAGLLPGKVPRKGAGIAQYRQSPECQRRDHKKPRHALDHRCAVQGKHEHGYRRDQGGQALALHDAHLHILGGDMGQQYTLHHDFPIFEPIHTSRYQERASRMMTTGMSSQSGALRPNHFSAGVR